MSDTDEKFAQLKAVDSALAASLTEELTDDVIRLAAERDAIIRALSPMLDANDLQVLADYHEAFTRSVQAQREQVADALGDMRLRQKATRAYEQVRT